MKAVRGWAAQVSGMPGKKAAAPSSSERGNVKTPTHETMALAGRRTDDTRTGGPWISVSSAQANSGCTKVNKVWKNSCTNTSPPVDGDMRHKGRSKWTMVQMDHGSTQERQFTQTQCQKVYKHTDAWQKTESLVSPALVVCHAVYPQFHLLMTKLKVIILLCYIK